MELKKLYYANSNDIGMIEALLDEDPELREQLAKVEDNFCLETLNEYLDMVDYFAEQEDAEYIGSERKVLKADEKAIFIEYHNVDYDDEVVAYFLGNPITEEYDLPLDWPELISESQEE